MSDLILTTFDWVPATPPGYVRDVRLCWALAEAGLPVHAGPHAVGQVNKVE